jgi:hypothetical protein
MEPVSQMILQAVYICVLCNDGIGMGTSPQNKTILKIYGVFDQCVESSDDGARQANTRTPTAKSAQGRAESPNGGATLKK